MHSALWFHTLVTLMERFLFYGVYVNAAGCPRRVRGPWGDVIRDQRGSLVVIQVPCSYMTSQSDLLIRLTISCPNTHKGQINIAGGDWLRWAGRWGRWADQRHCFGVNVMEKEKKDSDARRLLYVDDMYIVNVMCKQVNNSTRELFAFSVSLSGKTLLRRQSTIQYIRYAVRMVQSK